MTDVNDKGKPSLSNEGKGLKEI